MLVCECACEMQDQQTAATQENIRVAINTNFRAQRDLGNCTSTEDFISLLSDNVRIDGVTADWARYANRWRSFLTTNPEFNFIRYLGFLQTYCLANVFNTDQQNYIDHRCISDLLSTFTAAHNIWQTILRNHQKRTLLSDRHLRKHGLINFFDPTDDTWTAAHELQHKIL